MREGRPSRTAQGVANLRAAEVALHPRARRIFDDPIAPRLAGLVVRALARVPPLLRLLVAADAWRHDGLVHEVVARARCAQERLDAALAAGVRQVVVLGAGFDGTAWRAGLPPDLRVFEVDHPATQGEKRRRLARAGLAEPPGVVFVPLVLGGGALPPALARAGHRANEPSFVTLLGVIPYLDEPVAGEVFREIAAIMAPGSEAVYSWHEGGAAGWDAWPPGRRLARRLERLGEPLRFGGNEGRLSEMVRRAGLTPVEVLDGVTVSRRLFEASGDGRRLHPSFRLGRAVRDGARLTPTRSPS